MDGELDPTAGDPTARCPGSGGSESGGPESGMVTAELATALPVLVLLIFIGLAAVWVGQERLRCVDAAREAARAVARGDAGGAPRLATAVAGRQLAVDISSAGELSRVRVSLPVRPVSWLPGFTITESAVTATEPGNPDPGP